MTVRTPPRPSPIRWCALALLLALAACTTAPPKHGAPIMRDQSHWVPVSWKDPPGWNGDGARAAWPALVSSCERPAQAWTKLSASVQREPPPSDAHARDWL